MLVSVRAANESGAARRRQRRLRQWLRHERLSVAMALAECQHHAAPRGQSMARAGGEESEMNTATGQKTPLPRAASTVHFDLFDEGDVLAARPTPLVEVRATAGGSAAHRGVHRRCCAHGTDPRCACAAFGGTGGGSPSEDRCAVASRAGYQRAQDLTGLGSASHGGPSSSAADGGTVDGSAHDRVLFFSSGADCRADRRYSSSRSWRGRGWHVEVVDRIQLHLWSRSLTFRLAVVFQVLPDRIVQRTVEQILVLKIVSLDRIQLRTWCRPLLSEVFQVFSQVRVPQRPHRVCMMSLMLEFKGFFALFPG